MEGRIEMSPLSLTSPLWPYNTRPQWVTCQLFQTYRSNTDYCLNFQWILSTFLLLHMTSPCLSFMQRFASIWLHGAPFVFPPHPVWKGQSGTKKRWGCFCSVRCSGKPPSAFSVQIRLLDVRVYIPSTDGYDDHRAARVINPRPARTSSAVKASEPDA